MNYDKFTWGVGDLVIDDAGDLTKHGGPGPHESGSPQSVHGGGEEEKNKSYAFFVANDEHAIRNVTVVPGARKYPWEMGRKEYQSLRVVYRGAVPLSESSDFAFFTNDEKVAATFGEVKSYRVLPGAKIYPDPEIEGFEGRDLSGADSLDLGSAVISFEDLVPNYDFDTWKKSNGAGDLTKHGGPGPHESGSPQSVHGGGDGSSNESTGVMAYDDPEGFVTDPKNENLPDEMKNELDGGPGSSIQFHGSSSFIPVNGKFKDAETYITPQSDEANGYAFGNHRMENLPKGYRITVKRKPGRTLNISDAITNGFDAGLEPDEIISRIAPVARSHGFRYLYHDHPSFGGNEVQLALISLYPNEDLKILNTSKVYNKSYTAGDLTKAAPPELPPSFWEEEMRRLAIIILPRLTSLALEGMREGAAKIGIGFNYAIYSVLAEQWARDYTDQLLKNVRTTNEAVVGEILAKWIATPGRTIGDLRVALSPYFGIKRANTIAVTEATRALASGEIMAYQRAGVEEIRWGTNNDELVCPLCGPLHGVVRKIGEPFGYFKWRKNTNPEPVFTPPFHPNCRCGISPVINLKRNLFSAKAEYTSVFGNALVQMNSLIIRTTIAMIPPAWSIDVEV